MHARQRWLIDYRLDETLGSKPAMRQSTPEPGTGRAPSGVEAIRWRDGALTLLDQRRLPAEETWLDMPDLDTAAAAIRDLVVRGAPAIGITAAYACVLAMRARSAEHRGNDRAAREAWLEANNKVASGEAPDAEASAATLWCTRGDSSLLRGRLHSYILHSTFYR